MKRLLDINTWIALAVETHPQHVAARKWYGETELDQGDLVFCRQTELGFLRLVTQQAKRVLTPKGLNSPAQGRAAHPG